MRDFDEGAADGGDGADRADSPTDAGDAADAATSHAAEPVVDLDRLAAFLETLATLLLRSSGEGAERIGRTLDAVARAYGARAELLIVPEAATMTVTTGAGSRTAVVRGFPEVSRLDRLVALRPLVTGIVAGHVGLPEADRRLRAIGGSPDPVPAWLRFLGLVLFALGFAPAMQRTWYEIGTTAVLAAVTGALVLIAGRVPRLALVLPLVAAAAVSAVVLGGFDPAPSRGGQVLIMLPALFYFVPGDYLSAASYELVAGQISTGAIRLVYSSLLLAQLYVGILLGSALTGQPMRDVFDFAAHSDLPRWAPVLSWAVFGVGTVLAFGIPARLLGWVLLLVYLPLAVQTALTDAAGEVAGTFGAAAVLSAAAGWLSRPAGRPPRLVLLLGGFFTLTVGSLGVRGLTTLAGHHLLEGFKDLGTMITIVTAIALGLLAGAACSPGAETGAV